MSAFGGMILTNKGRNLQAKAQVGAQLNFTRIGVGDGELGGSSILDLNALKHEVKSVPITKFSTLPGGKAVCGGAFDNQGLIEGFYWREIGLFATDPDLGEILYCYGNAGVNAEYIPAGGGPDPMEKHVDIVSIVGNAANVTATIEQSLVFVSVQDLDTHKDENASAATKGHIQLATNAEVTTGTDTSKAVTPAGAKVELDKKVPLSLFAAANDFIIGSAAGVAVKKTLAEVRTILACALTTGFTMTAGVADFANFIVTRAHLKSYSEVIGTTPATTGTVTFDLATGNTFNLTPTGPCTIGFVNPPADGRVGSVTLNINMGAVLHAMTFNAAIKANKEDIPVFVINKTAIITFFTLNAGGRWYMIPVGMEFTT